MPMILANVIQDAFGPLIKVFEAILVFIHSNITGGSWGLAIIGLTIVVRAALVPLTLKQFSSMAKLQALGPELKELQKRYKDDKQRLNEEMMKFYKQNEVNPFGSCLPLVMQLPVFLSLFYMLRVDLKQHICGPALKAAGITSQTAISKTSCGSISVNGHLLAAHSGKFLFIPDITSQATGAVLVVLIVLYIGSQLVSSLLTTATVDRNQRMLMLGLPFVFSIFIARFPAGLLVYWITTNLWTVGQQYIVRKRAGPIVAAPAPAGGTGRPAKRVVANEDEAPIPKAGGQGLLARMAAARDSARSAVTGEARPADAPANGRASVKESRGPTKASAGAVSAKSAGARPSRRGAKPAGASATAKDDAKPAVAKPAGSRPAGTKATRGGQAQAKSGAAKSKAAPASPKPDGKTTGEGGSGKDTPAAPRARGAAPPPPPRKKKKRSGRRR
jgi:YidC/Oxa1 family membrane protein insertase